MTNRESILSLLSSQRKILFPLFFISSFILHPSSFLRAQHARLYACALASDAPGAFMGGSSMGAGLWQSDDTARTWKQIGWKHVKCYSVDVVQKSNGKIIYQACGNGVLRSKDDGSTWRMLTDWRITEVLDIAIDQKAPENIYIATPTGIWKTMDAGESWFEADTDIPMPKFTSLIKIDSKDHLRIYAGSESETNYTSSDGGLRWSKVKTSGVQGSLWSGIPKSPKNIHSTVTIGSYQFLGSLDGGVWKYENFNDSELSVRTGLDSLQVWKLRAIEVK